MQFVIFVIVIVIYVIAFILGVRMIPKMWARAVAQYRDPRKKAHLLEQKQQEVERRSKFEARQAELEAQHLEQQKESERYAESRRERNLELNLPTSAGDQISSLSLDDLDPDDLDPLLIKWGFSLGHLPWFADTVRVDLNLVEIGHSFNTQGLKYGEPLTETEYRLEGRAKGVLCNIQLRACEPKQIIETGDMGTIRFSGERNENYTGDPATFYHPLLEIVLFDPSGVVGTAIKAAVSAGIASGNKQACLVLIHDEKPLTPKDVLEDSIIKIRRLYIEERWGRADVREARAAPPPQSTPDLHPAVRSRYSTGTRWLLGKVIHYLIRRVLP